MCGTSVILGIPPRRAEGHSPSSGVRPVGLTFVLGPFLAGRSAQSAGRHRPVGWQLLGTPPGQTNQGSHGLQPAEGLGGLEGVLFGGVRPLSSSEAAWPLPWAAGST